MKKSLTSIVWGIGLILVGILLAGDAFNIISFNIFFSGWWTLFIIIPCGLGLLGEGNKTNNLIGLCIGIMLLLSRQNIVEWYVWRRLFVPFILIVIGCSLLFRDKLNKERKDRFHNNDYANTGNNENKNFHSSEVNENNSYASSDANEQDMNFSSDANEQNMNFRSDANEQNVNFRSDTRQSNQYASPRSYTTILSGRVIKFDDEVFTGVNLTCILGSIDLNLKNAIINEDVTIDISTILGGVDIIVPQNVRIVINSTPILGGVDNHAIPPKDVDVATIYINASCVLGGIDIK